jgi:hypothetical protein
VLVVGCDIPCLQLSSYDEGSNGNTRLTQLRTKRKGELWAQGNIPPHNLCMEIAVTNPKPYRGSNIEGILLSCKKANNLITINYQH